METVKKISAPLARVFNVSLKEELVLIDWKEANICVAEHARLSMPGSACQVQPYFRKFVRLVIMIKLQQMYVVNTTGILTYN